MLEIEIFHEIFHMQYMTLELNFYTDKFHMINAILLAKNATGIHVGLTNEYVRYVDFYTAISEVVKVNSITYKIKDRTDLIDIKDANFVNQWLGFFRDRIINSKMVIINRFTENHVRK